MLAAKKQKNADTCFTRKASHQSVAWRLGPAAIMLMTIIAAAPATAHAQVYGYWGWWGPPPPQPPRLISAHGQYYDFTASGLIDLCDSQSALCASPQQQHMVAALKKEETMGWGLLFGGIGAGVAGAVVLITAPCSANGDCISNARGITGASLLFGSLGLELAAALIWPTTQELVRLINDINHGHEDNPPLRLQATLLAPKTPGVMVGWQF